MRKDLEIFLIYLTTYFWPLFPLNFPCFKRRMKGNIGLKQINSFHATGLFLYPLNISENFRFFDVFRGYRKRPVAWNELTYLSKVPLHERKIEFILIQDIFNAWKSISMTILLWRRGLNMLFY